jgi:uncharacterized RDD family membrane protein YckC
MTGHDDVVYASLGRRLATFLLDLAVMTSMILLVAVCLRVLRAVGLWVPHVADVTPQEVWFALGPIAKMLVVITFVVSTGPFYFVLCEASAWQATFGKRLLNFYIADDGGRRISLARASGRWIIKWISNWFWVSLISILTIALTRERKAVHDYAVGTIAVRGRPVPGGALDPWRIIVGLGLPFVWMLGTFLATL